MTQSPSADSTAAPVPHVLPVAAYLAVFGALLVLTAITVAVSYLDFGVLNVVIALGVATAKASLVALIFMHLAFDKRFNAIVFLSSLVFLGVFIALTMADTANRGVTDAMEGERPADISAPFAGTRAEKAVKDSAARRGLPAPAPAPGTPERPTAPAQK